MIYNFENTMDFTDRSLGYINRVVAACKIDKTIARIVFDMFKRDCDTLGKECQFFDFFVNKLGIDQFDEILAKSFEQIILSEKQKLQDMFEQYSYTNTTFDHSLIDQINVVKFLTTLDNILKLNMHSLFNFNLSKCNINSLNSNLTPIFIIGINQEILEEAISSCGFSEYNFSYLTTVNLADRSSHQHNNIFYYIKSFYFDMIHQVQGLLSKYGNTIQNEIVSCLNQKIHYIKTNNENIIDFLQDSEFVTLLKFINELPKDNFFNWQTDYLNAGI